MDKKRFMIPAWVLIVAFISFANPNINLIDPIPDFIGSTILWYVFAKGIAFAPYFDEAATAFRRMAIVGMLRVPAVFLMFGLKNSGGGSDTITLFSFLFAFAETILTIRAISAGFDAVFYLGERTSADVLLKPFGKHHHRPATIGTLAIILVIVKAIASCVPELLLLTGGDDGMPLNVRMKIYPIALVAGIVAVLICGTAFAIFASGYAVAVRGSNCYATAMAEMQAKVPPEESNRRLSDRRIGQCFSFFTVAFFFLLAPTASSNAHVSILPNFLFAVFLLPAYGRLRSMAGIKPYERITAIVYGCISALSYAAQLRFHFTWSLNDLIENEAARRAYMIPAGLSVLESVSFLFLIVGFTGILFRFISVATATPPGDPTYRPVDADFHKMHRKRVLGLSICATLTSFAGTATIIFDGIPRLIATAIPDLPISAIRTGGLPWFGTVATLIGIVTFFYALCQFGSLRDAYREKLGLLS